MDKSKLYYLSHPCTTYSDRISNVKDAKRVEIILKIKYGIKVINPIVILPAGLSEKEAMRRCRCFYEACDEVILCENWNKSVGCNTEFKWSVTDGKHSHFVKGDVIIE